MGRRHFIIPPVSIPVLLVMFVLFLAVFIMFSSAVMVAFERLGIPPEVAYTLFLFSLLGSFINIPPIAEETTYEPVIGLREVRFFGILYPPVPYFDWPRGRW